MYRHTKATDNDVLIETMNENNWYQLLKDSIVAALQFVTERVPFAGKSMSKNHI